MIQCPRISAGTSDQRSDLEAWRVWMSVYRQFRYFPAYALYFLLLFVPTSYRAYKSLLLVVIVGVIVARIALGGRIFLHKAVVFWTLLMVLVGMAFIARGLVLGAPGALRVTTVNVLWPIVYLIGVAGMKDEKVFAGLCRVMVGGVFAIGLYTFLYFAKELKWWIGNFYFELDAGQLIGFYDGFVEYNMYSISSLVYLVPFICSASMAWPASRRMPVSIKWLIAALFLGFLLVFLSGRRGLVVATGIAPLITMMLMWFLPRDERIASGRLWARLTVGGAVFAVVAALGLRFVVGFEFEKLIGALVRATIAEVQNPESARYRQLYELLSAWLDAPFFGAGHGSSAPNLIRSDDQPWSYELSFVALLFQVGAVGFALYAAAVLWIYLAGIFIVSRGGRLALYMIPMLTALTCFLIANFTNPYLAKFDFIWVVFLPIALINFWLLEGCKPTFR